MDRWQIYEPIGLLDSVGHNLVVLCDGILFIVIRFFGFLKLPGKWTDVSPPCHLAVLLLLLETATSFTRGMPCSTHSFLVFGFLGGIMVVNLILVF